MFFIVPLGNSGGKGDSGDGEKEGGEDKKREWGDQYRLLSLVASILCRRTRGDEV